MSLVAVTQVLPLQQPLQLVSLQTLPPTHEPVLQVEPLRHGLQLAPFTPHEVVVCEADATHAPPEQQPAQLKKSQAVVAVH